MEHEMRAFLLKVANTISLVLLWMLVNLVVGIKYNLAFFEDKPSWINICYYAGMLLSLGWLVWHLRKKWKL